MNIVKQAETQTARDASDYIYRGVEVNADMESDDRYENGMLNSALLPIIEKWGAKEVLAAIHDAALGAAEVHEEFVNEGEMAPFRLQVFCQRLRAAMDCLK